MGYAEEHSASNQASELLEAEQAQRVKLQKELKDVQQKYDALQRKHEITEMDLMHTRLLASSYDGDMDEEEVEEASVYREKYERIKRELDFTKKKLKDEYEEQLEQKDAVKKQTEKKLNEALSEKDESDKTLVGVKKKIQRLTADMQDSKRHLEDQVNRNSELEKKQRKFDQELQKVNNNLKDEKKLKEKFQKE